MEYILVEIVHRTICKSCYY